MIIGKNISFKKQKEIYTQNFVDFFSIYIPIDCTITSVQYINGFLWFGLLEKDAPYSVYVKVKPSDIINEISSNLSIEEIKFLKDGKSLLNLGNGSLYGLGILSAKGLDIGNFIFKFGFILLIIAVILIRKILKR